jgi:hypothetical protein
LLHHDIFVCTEIPSFVAPRYFLTCTNSFRSNFSNTVVQRRDISSTVFKIYAAVVPSAATRR